MEDLKIGVNPTPIEKFQTPHETIGEMLDLQSRMKDLEGKMVGMDSHIESVKGELNDVKKGIEKVSTFIMWVVSAIAVAFLVIVVEVSLDYFKDNEDRYEKSVERIQKLESDFYKRDELGYVIKNTNDNTRILECLRLKGYLSKECFIKY